MSMKLFFVTILSALTIFPAYSGKQKAYEIDKADKFKMDFGWGIPIKAYVSEDAIRFSLGGNWNLADGILNTKHFGRNGAIDYGILYSLLYYYGNRYETDTWREHVVLKERDNHIDLIEPSFFRHRFVFRSAFHFQFLKKLVAHGGIFGGFGVVKPLSYYKEYMEKAESYIEKSLGVRTGATWYFNECVGIGLEWETEFDSNYGINETGNSLNLKYNFLFTDKSKRERTIKKRERDLEKLRKDQKELEEWYRDEE